jgi:hypothetical protein
MSQSNRIELEDGEKSDVVQLATSVFELGFEEYRIFRESGDRPHCLSRESAEERGWGWEDGRLLESGDLRVTQVWSRKNQKSAHLGQPKDGRRFRLGIRFKTWRNKSPVNKLSIIIHELGHLVTDYHSHGENFWQRIADATENICEKRGEVSKRLGLNFTPSVLRNDVLSGIRYADGLDKDRDSIMSSIASRMEYPVQAVGNMNSVGVGATEYAREKSDECVPATEITLADKDLEHYSDSFVWGQMRQMAPAGRLPSESISFTSALPVTKNDEGPYETQGYSSDWQLVAAKRVYEHGLALRGDKQTPPQVPIQIEEDEH